MKIRIKFKKEGLMKYIGHLDIMRFFQKAIRRADLDIAYTEGYSPHQIMSFALPLGVGVTSEGEYLDIQINSEINSSDAIERLNLVMADGITITDFVSLPDDAKKSMAIVGAASYTVKWKKEFAFPFDLSQLKQIKEDFFYKTTEINILKKTKKSEKIVDIKPLIYSIDVNFNENDIENTFVVMKIAAGSENNLKPELVIEAIYNFMEKDYNQFTIDIHRNELYTSDFIPLKDLGEEIG